MNEEKERLCAACGANLTGPFQPQIDLSQIPVSEQSELPPQVVTAYSWVCADCGLVHWYARDPEQLDPQPDSSYQRRAQMLRMLRRVRRM